MRCEILVALFGLSLCAFSGPPASSSTSSAPLGNEDIVRLVMTGTAEGVILQAIARRPVAFDLDRQIVDELIVAGVSDRIIKAMRLRQREMPPGAPPEAGPSVSRQDAPGATPEGRLVLALDRLAPDRPPDESAPFAIRALPEGVKRPPGVEVGRVTDLALAVLCRTSDHVPDHWDLLSPIEGAPRHGVLLFLPGSTPAKLKKFDIIRLNLQEIPPIVLAEGRHALIVALTGRSTGTGAWQFLTSDSIDLEVKADSTARLSLEGWSTLRGNRMTGFSVEHDWKIAPAAGKPGE